MTDKAIKIDVGEVLAQKLGSKARYVPRAVVRLVEKLIHQEELNGLLESNFPKRGAEFCEGVLADLDVKLEIEGQEHMPENPRCLIVSNHPLGGLDGIAMIAWLSRHYGRPVHFVVNDMLMVVDPLSDCFVPVNTVGKQNRHSAEALDSVLAGNDPVVIYPAGLVSRLGADGTVADLRWRKMAVTKAIESRRDVVPVYFDGANSPSFYKWARRRTRLGIKFNYEMVLLPREVFRARGKTFRLLVGEPLGWQTLDAANPTGQAEALRSLVYSLPKKHTENI